MVEKIELYLIPRLQDILFFCIFYLVIVLGQNMLSSDGDLSRHLLAGKLILQDKSLPDTEPFLYPLAGETYVSHEWLSDVIFYLVNEYFGLSGIILLAALLLSSTFTVLYASLSARWDRRIPIILLVMWGTLATIPNWITRPYLFSMLFLSIWLIMTDELSRNRSIPIWGFPAVMILWCNLHGEFIAGILVMVAYTAGWWWDYILHKESDLQTGKKLGAALALSLLASLFHPSGVQSWQVILGFLNNRYLTSMINEARPPNFQELTFSLLFGLLLFSIFKLATHNGKISTDRAILLTGFSAMSLFAARNIHLYCIVAPFVLAETLTAENKFAFINKMETTFSNMESRLRGIFWPVAITIGFCIFVLPANSHQFNPKWFPVDAVAWLKTHPQEGRMFNEISWGGYIAWYLWPDQSVFIDSIGDFEGELTREYLLAVTSSPNDDWQDVFTKYDISWVVIPTNSPLTMKLLDTKEWTLLYQDDTAIILRR
jgi:hypothetical protein